MKVYEIVRKLGIDSYPVDEPIAILQLLSLALITIGVGIMVGRLILIYWNNRGTRKEKEKTEAEKTIGRYRE